MRRSFVCLGCAAVAAGLFIGVVWIGKSGGVQGETCFRRGEVMIRQGTPFGSTAGGGEALDHVPPPRFAVRVHSTAGMASTTSGPAFPAVGESVRGPNAEGSLPGGSIAITVADLPRIRRLAELGGWFNRKSDLQTAVAGSPEAETTR